MTTTAEDLLKEQNRLLRQLVRQQRKTSRNTSQSAINSELQRELIELGIAASALLIIATGSFVKASWIGFINSPIARMLGIHSQSQTVPQSNMSGFYASPLQGVSLQAIIDYVPVEGQQFRALRDYGPHGGIDYDCSIGGCEGAVVVAPIAGVITQTEAIATSKNGDSYEVIIKGQDWTGPVKHYLTHIDTLSVQVGDRVFAGQAIARVAPDDSISTDMHLDWKIQRNGIFEDPRAWAITANQHALGFAGAFHDTEMANFIKGFEDFRSEAYWDYGQWSNGWGTEALYPGENIDIATADQRLYAELSEVDALIGQLVTVPLERHQRQALISFTFNVGEAQFRESTLLAKLNAGELHAAANEFDYWTKATDINTGEINNLAGLKDRRRQEKALFLGQNS